MSAQGKPVASAVDASAARAASSLRWAVFRATARTLGLGAVAVEGLARAARASSAWISSAKGGNTSSGSPLVWV